jgi:hypothetical protein
MKQSATSWMGAIALAIMIAASIGASASDKKISIDELVASAKTSEDHNAVAAAYEDEAASLDRKAASHERLANLYKNSPPNPKGAGNMSAHCQRIVNDLRETAKLHRELAEHHRALANEHH